MRNGKKENLPFELIINCADSISFFINKKAVLIA
jgi:hypothetical protein